MPKPTECTTPRVNPNVKLWTWVITSVGSSAVTDVPLWWDVDYGGGVGGCACVGTLYFFAQNHSEPKTAKNWGQL